MKKIPAKILKERKKKALAIIKVLHKIDPHPKTALLHSNSWELVVAIQLSAQCTDKKVNEVTRSLFKKYGRIVDYAKANSPIFDNDIRQITFHRNKTRNIIAAANKILKDFKGKIPKTIPELLTLPGMGRKSANVFLSAAHGVGEGIAVDTHVWRLARMLGLTDENTPDKIEQDLLQVVPKRYWPIFNFLLVDYGRAYCPARKHDHNLKKCPLGKFYVRDQK